jgi:hypothetical protein
LFYIALTVVLRALFDFIFYLSLRYFTCIYRCVWLCLAMFRGLPSAQ